MANNTIKIKIKTDSKQIMAALSEFELYLPNVPDRFRKRIGKFFLDIDNVPSKIKKFISVKSAPAPDSRTTTIVTIKPTKFFLDLITACRTGKFDNIFVKRNLHKTSEKGT